MAIVTAVELDGVSHKSIPGTLFLQSWWGVIVLMHAKASHAQDCPDWRLEKAFFPYSKYKNVFIPGNTLFSLVLVGSYSAIATASHAQDCPG